MIETAGRVADGLLGHTLFSPRYVEEVVRPAIARGAAHAGRDPAEVRLATYALACADDDEALARRDAAAMIAFYGVGQVLRAALRVLGLRRRGGGDP